MHSDIEGDGGAFPRVGEGARVKRGLKPKYISFDFSLDFSKALYMVFHNVLRQAEEVHAE